MFCYKCGNQIREDQAFCDKCGAPQNKPNNATESTNNPLESQEESRSSILQFIRGIPFGLVFLAFLLPLFVVSCPQVGKDIASYSAYQSMDIVGSLSEMFHQMGEFAADSDIKELQGSLFKFGVMCAVMLVLTVAAFGFSFIKRIVAAVLGIAGLLDMMIIVFSLCGKSTNVVAVSPGSGFYLAVLLFLAGIIMCFIAPKNEKELPSGAKIGIYIGIVVISAIIVVVGFSGTGSANKDSQDGQTMTDPRDGQTYRIVTIGSQTWMAENLNFEYSVKNQSWRYGSCYNFNEDCKTFGRYYTWAAAMDSAGKYSSNGKGCGFYKACSPTYPVRGICPEGWHLPDATEWKTLYKAIGQNPFAMQAKGHENWKKATNTSNFSALPGGYDSHEGFIGDGKEASFWSATKYDNHLAYHWDVDANDAALYYYDDNSYGRTVRCVKD
jgi:uncharacterized protein (TIGR02145 family)